MPGVIYYNITSVWISTEYQTAESDNHYDVSSGIFITGMGFYYNFF